MDLTLSEFPTGSRTFWAGFPQTPTSLHTLLLLSRSPLALSGYLSTLAVLTSFWSSLNLLRKASPASPVYPHC